MIDEILKNKPKGATHWQAGAYYWKTPKGNWFKHQKDKRWKPVKKEFMQELCMTPLH